MWLLCVCGRLEWHTWVWQTYDTYDMYLPSQGVLVQILVIVRHCSVPGGLVTGSPTARLNVMTYSSSSNIWQQFSFARPVDQQYSTVQYSTVHFIWQDEVQQSPIDGDAEHVILKVESRSLTALQLSVIFKSELDKNHYRYISLVIWQRMIRQDPKVNQDSNKKDWFTNWHL